MYGEVFANIYNARWAGFANRVAPAILDYYAAISTGKTDKNVLDLCCGTGQFALEALERGYRVLGIDASEHMLRHARANTREYIETGQASFRTGDARRFTTPGTNGLVVCLFDSLNHLGGMADLESCFQCVFAALEGGGVFVFDLNTESGLKKHWNTISITDEEEVMIVNRGIYIEETHRAYTKISGFAVRPDGLYERFDEVMFNTAFEIEAVRRLLHEAGWDKIHCARVQDLATPIAEPEKETRVFFVASK